MMARTIRLWEAVRTRVSTRGQRGAVSGLLLTAAIAMIVFCAPSRGADPPVIDPFGPKATAREDAMPGYIEMSDGAVHPGRVYLTRDVRLKIYDEKLERQREIPLSAVKQIECAVQKEWMEKEWKFKEAASSEKVYTGRSYPVREYLHTITLHDDRTVAGPLSGIVYLQPYSATPGDRASAEPERYLLNKRSKGEIGDELESLVYVKRIKLGEEALAEGKEMAAKQRSE